MPNLEKSIQGNFPLSFLLILSFFFLPMYIFSSGGFQLVDVPLAITIIVAFFWRDALSKYNNAIIFWLVPFTIWVFLINFSYYLLYQNIWEFLSFIAIAYGFVILYHSQ